MAYRSERLAGPERDAGSMLCRPTSAISGRVSRRPDCDSNLSDGVDGPLHCIDEMDSPCHWIGIIVPRAMFGMREFTHEYYDHRHRHRKNRSCRSR